jgi:hypothetical protein
LLRRPRRWKHICSFWAPQRSRTAFRCCMSACSGSSGWGHVVQDLWLRSWRAFHWRTRGCVWVSVCGHTCRACVHERLRAWSATLLNCHAHTPCVVPPCVVPPSPPPASCPLRPVQRNVPETIAVLSDAGCRFWMCTGDKFSTALTIAQTCNLKLKTDELVTLEGTTELEVGDPCGRGGSMFTYVQRPPQLALLAVDDAVAVGAAVVRGTRCGKRCRPRDAARRGSRFPPESPARASERPSSKLAAGWRGAHRWALPFKPRWTRWACASPASRPPGPLPSLCAGTRWASR